MTQTTQFYLMSKNAFHPSIEGAQHGAKSLEAFLDNAQDVGAEGVQPGKYMLQGPKNGTRKLDGLWDAFALYGSPISAASARTARSGFIRRIYRCHEVHQGTAASTADDFNNLQVS